MSRLRRRKFVITIHGGAFVKFMNRPLYRRIFRLIALNLADSTIAFDQAIYKKLVEILPPKKRKTAHYFPHPVNTELFNPETNGEEVRAKYGITKDQCLVLFGPHLEPVYIPDQFIEAASIILKKKPNVMFVLVGGGPQEVELRALVKKLKLDKFVIFVSSVPHEKMPEYFAACDVACNPCILGQGILTFEALACGKPVVGASAKTQIRIRDKVDGLLFEPGDVEDLASKIVWLLDHPEKRREMGMLGRSRVVKQNSLEAQVQDHVRIYRGITSN
jgi:glycosyltransferase involved in cell wall biosynthesis